VAGHIPIRPLTKWKYDLSNLRESAGRPGNPRRLHSAHELDPTTSLAGFLNCIRAPGLVAGYSVDARIPDIHDEQRPTMTNFQKLKHDARRAEQRSDWQRAIDLYRRALDFDPETVDLRIYNRIGDLHMRQGEADAAVTCYEQAAERYAGQGMHTSAIALCNKALRIAPDRDSIYRQLGGLHARTGLLAEGRRCCMIFVGRAIESGRLADAVKAVEEFVTETGDEQIRLAYADALQSHGDAAAAAEQIRIVHDARLARGSDASALLGRIKELEPQNHPESVTDSDPDPSVVEKTLSTVGDTVNLAALVAQELEATGFDCGFDPVTPPQPATVSSRSASDGLDGTRRLLNRFRAQLGEMLADDDLTIRYDLGVELMTIGLVDEAIEEFQRAIQDPALIEAANTRIAECLVSRWSGVQSAEPTAVRPSPVETAAQRPDAEPDSKPDPIETVDATPEIADETPDEIADEPEIEDETQVEDETDGHYFRARLAQYRIRRAEDRHTTDFAAHAELGAAYAEMDLFQEAVRELAVAVKGPRPIASRAARSLCRLGESADTLPELAIHIVEVLSAAALDEMATELAETLSDTWGEDHPLAGRLALVRKEAARAVDELPSLESLFPAVGSSDIEGTDVDAEMAPLPQIDNDDLRELDELLSELEEGEPSDGVSEALRVDDQHIEVLKAAEAHRKAGRFEEAETVLYELLDQLQEAHRPREAMTVVDRLLVLRPDDVVLYHQKTELSLMVNDRRGLLAAYAELGACLRRQGSARSARTAYGRVLDFDPVNEEARAAIADIDREELELENAAASVQSARRSTRTRASESERSEFDALLDDLGLDRSDDMEAVVPVTEVDAEPQVADPIVDADSRCELGLAFRQMGMWEEATVEIRAALPHLSDVSEALEALGESLHSLGNNEAVIKELRPLIDDAVNDSAVVGALYYLAQALRAEGQDSEARETLARVEAASPGYRDAAELLSELSL